MSIAQALAMPVYPYLPSGRLISYSEISTFQSCRRQHYWRYYVRLATKRYSEIRNMVMGSVVHEASEAVYRNLDADPGALLAAVIERTREELTDPSSLAYFDAGQFATDMVVAEQMFNVWYNHLYREEEFDIIEPEWKFEVEIANQLFVGVIDRLYELKTGKLPGIYVGELKTRGFSFRKGLKRVVAEDLQTKIYLAAVQAAGMDPKGVVYSVVKKPPQHMMTPMTGDDHDDVATRAAIETHYHTPSYGEHYKREVVPVTLDLAALEADLTAELRAIDDFYRDPEASLRETPVLSSGQFPCMFCEFSPLCHERRTIDGSFRYKRKRAA